MFTSLTIIVIITIMFIGFFWYRYMKRPTTTPQPTMTTTTSTTPIQTSKFFPDDWYIGKTVKLDPTLRTMFPTVLFDFPAGPLTIVDFRYFAIDGNQFEEVVFGRTNNQEYIIMYDSLEHNIYFLNRVMSETVGTETPQMVALDTIAFTEENGDEYNYMDMSGLIDVSVSGKKISSHSRLIRVYEREVTEEDHEFCICVMDDPKRVDYYLGFIIKPIQLEDL